MKQKPVWTEEEIRQLVLSGVDRERLDAMHSMAMYALTSTVKDRGQWRTTGNSIWPVYLDYVPNRIEVGNSRKILNTSRILLSEFSGVIVPETKGVDDTTNQERQQAWIVRSKGDGMGDGGWDVEQAQQYTDFRELGIGAVCHDELVDDQDLEYATLRHFRATDVIYDPSVRNPLRAKWYCRRTPFTKYEAIDLFGEKMVTVNELLPMGGGSYPLEIVWYYEFFSVPFAGRRATYCSWVGFPEEGKVHRTPRSARTDQLNVSWGVNYLPAASRWPIGGVWLQCATQALMGNLEQKFKRSSDRQSMTGIDLNYVKGKNLQQAQKNGGWLEMELPQDGDIRKAVLEIAGGQIDQGDLALYDLAQRQYNEDSGTTEQMRGNLSEQDRTLGEQQLAQMGAEKGQSYEKVQALAMTARVVNKTFDRMKRFDRSPMLIDLDGYDLLLNDPEDPRLSLEEIFRDKGEVQISPGSFSMSDDRVKRAQRAAELSDPNLVSLVGKTVSLEWYTEQVMKNKGENDPNAYKMPEQQQGMLGQVMGMIGQQPQPA